MSTSWRKKVARHARNGGSRVQTSSLQNVTKKERKVSLVAWRPCDDGWQMPAEEQTNWMASFPKVGTIVGCASRCRV